jgi:hypothetical protein
MQLININNIFGEVIEDLQLVDVRTTNKIFTSHNKRLGDKQLTYVLDRFFVSKTIFMGGGELEALVLPSESSNHWPICLEWRGIGTRMIIPFCFEQF